MRIMTMQTLKKLRIAMAILAVASGPAAAQTYTKTETITYANNTSKWILGQTATVTDASTGLVQSSTTYDSTYAMPITRGEFGALRQTLTYDTTSSLASGLRGTLTTVKDGNNKTTTLSSWKRGIPRTIQHPDTYSQSAVVNDSGWIESVTDENTYSTSYGHDAMGRISLITYPTGDTTVWTNTTRSVVPVASAEYGIPAGHWRETVTTGNAVKITYFDGMWRPLLVREYDSANQAGTERFVRQQYDERGRLSFKSYPSTFSSPTTGVWSDYDPLGRVESVSQDSELGLLSTVTTYNTGFTTTVTNPRNQPTTTAYMTYDQPSTDWPVTITAPESATTTIVRDVFGKPNSITRSGGGVSAVRTYAYNARQELCRTVEPETGATLFGYDNAGNLAWSAAGMASGTACPAIGSTTAAIDLRKVSRTYDNRNRLSTLAFPDGNGNQTWTYTPDGLPSTVSTNNAGNNVSNGYTYNKRRLLTGESMVPDTVQLGWGMGYGYNGLGQVISESYPAGVLVNYTVNALGQATQVTASSDGGAASTITSGGEYYPNGALKQFTYGNGIVHTMTQNARQLPSRSTDCTLSGTCAVANRRLDLTYTYDQNGNVAGIVDGTTAGEQTRAMTYDGLDRLTQATSPAAAFGTASYVYDAIDNLKQVTVSAGTTPRTHYYCYGSATNRLDFVRTGSNCASSPAAIALSYDVQGNLSVKNGATYTFDYGNRLRTTAGLTYRYDAEGRRVRQDAAGGSLKYSYYAKDGRVVWQRDEPASKRISNIYFAGSAVAEYSRPIGSTAVTINYLHTDALGSPIAKTNASKVDFEPTKYEPFGLMLRPNDDRVGFTGHVMDSASGLTYMQQRYYDPQIGRFLSVDPVTADETTGDNFNRYWYANNNPYNFTDPDGRQSRRDKEEVTGSHIRGSEVAAMALSGGEIRSSSGSASAPTPGSKEWSNQEAKKIAQNFTGALGALAQLVEGLVDGDRQAVMAGGFGLLPGGKAVTPMRVAGFGLRGGARPFFANNAAARRAAEAMGFTVVRGQRPHGQLVFTDGKRFISRDVDGHSGGAWKVANSADDLARNKRVGTYNADLSVKIGK